MNRISGICILLLLTLIFKPVLNAQWTEIFDLEGNTVFDFAISDSGIWLASMDGVYYLDIERREMQSFSSGFTDTYISDIDVFGYYLVAAGRDGIYLSKDKGQEWENVSGSEFASLNIRSVASNDSMLLTGINGGLYMSKNSGRSWNDFSEGISAYATFVIKNEGDHFLAATDGGVYLSRASLNSWDLINEEIIRDILAEGELVVLGGDYGIFVSDDLGNNWEHRVEGMEGSLVTSLARVGDSYFAGTQSSGIYQSPDLMNWEALNQGLEELNISSLVAYRDSLLLCGTGTGKIAYLNIISLGNHDRGGPAAGVTSLHLWPNPAGDFVYFDMGYAADKVQIDLFTSNGMFVRSEMVSATGPCKIEMPVQKGLYFLRLRTEDGMHITRKLVRR